MALTFDKIKDLIGINGTVGGDLLGSARVRDNLFVSGYLTVGGKKFTGLNINGVKAIDKNVKWKGTEIEISKGGTGKDLSSATGAIQVSSGTLTAATLDVDKGGTGDIVDTTWKNSLVTTKADGTLNYDGTEAVTPDIASIDGTLTVAKGGTGADFSGTATGFIRIINGTAAQRAYDDAKTDLSLNNVDNTSDANKPVSSATQTALNAKSPIASPTFTGTVNLPEAPVIAGNTIIFEGDNADAHETTLTITEPTGDRVWTIPNATDTAIGKATTDTLTNKTYDAEGTGNSLSNITNSNIKSGAAIATSKLSGAATSITSHGLAASATTDTTVASNISSGTLPDAQHSTILTNNLDANGLKNSRALGDGIETSVVWADESKAGASDGDTPAASTIWTTSHASGEKKIVFNYLHHAETSYLELVCNLRTDNATYNAYVILAVYAMTTGTVAAASTGSALASVIGNTTSTTFTQVKAECDVTSHITAGTVHRVEILMYSKSGLANAFMTGAVVMSRGV